MHDQLTEILDQEVVGQICRDPDDAAALADVGLGRVCLDILDRAAVDALVARLGEAYGPGLQVTDRLHLDQPEQPVRGLVEVCFPMERGGYLLQISSPCLLAFYERRFLLEPEVVGDLCGVFCKGLGRLVTGGFQAPLRLLSGYDALEQRYLECLDAAVQASVNDEAVEPDDWVEELSGPVRESWRMIPWPLRETLQPIWRPGSDQTAPHEEVLRRTVLVATNVQDGSFIHRHAHAHHPLEDYGSTMGWMLDLAGALEQANPRPLHEVAVARASTVERFLECFPGFSRMLGGMMSEQGV